MRKPLIERFEEKFERGAPNECWLWKGLKFRSGYGRIGSGCQGKRTVLAHRISYELYVGPIPDGLCVCHRCDVRDCINPHHLFLGTKTENAADMDRKGRRARGSSHGMSKISEVDVLRIRKLASDGLTQNSISEMFRVNRQQVSHIVNHKCWAHIEPEGES